MENAKWNLAIKYLQLESGIIIETASGFSAIRFSNGEKEFFPAGIGAFQMALDFLGN